MLTPDYIDKIPDEVVRLYEQAEDDILRYMAGSIAAMDYYIPAAQWQEIKLQEMGMCHDEIVARLSQITGKSRSEVNAIIKASGAEALAADGDIYKAAGYKLDSALASPYLKAVIRSGMVRTNKLFQNLTRTTANTATKQFENALDRAFMQVSTGAFSTQQAAEMAIKDIARSGVQSITYPTGHTDSLDVAVRRAVRTGVNQSSAKITEALADEFGCDLVEVTAHFGARPSHAEWQGQVYSISGRTPGYDNFYDATGYGTGDGLCGWNCRHSFMPYFEGTARTYSQRRLDEMRDATVDYNGRQIPYYEATQIERSIERNVRRWKREYEAMSAGGMPTGYSAAKISEWNGKYSDFIRQTGLKPNYANVSVQGFSRSQARQATAAAKRYTTHKAGTVVKVKNETLRAAQSVGGKNVVGEWKRRTGEFKMAIDDILDYQGFNGLPSVVSRDEFDRILGEDHFVASRTYAANTPELLESYADMLRNGRFYVDCSVGGAQYGQGMYCAADYTKVHRGDTIKEVSDYIKLNRMRGNKYYRIETITMQPSARVFSMGSQKVSRTDLFKGITAEYINSNPEHFGIDPRAITERASLTKDALRRADAAYTKAYNGIIKELSQGKRDIGVMAAELGFDAINAVGHGKSGSYTVVLNRTKMVLLGG